MATFTVVVEAPSETGATDLEIQERTKLLGWVTVLDTSSVGAHPNYTTSHSVTATSSLREFRYRWTVDGEETDWFTPESITTAPSAAQADRLKGAIVAKATRLLLLPEAPFGVSGEVTEYGAVMVKPDYQIGEMLMGLRYQDLDLTGITVTATDVIRGGFNTELADFNAARITDVEDAIESAKDWVAETLEGLAVA